jgi:hypothetical protein
MKYAMTVILSTLLLALPGVGMAADDSTKKPKETLCTAKDVQHNIDILRGAIVELQTTHDTQRGMQMLHDHMALIIDNQEIMLGLLDKGGKKGVKCPDPRAHIKK